MAAVDASAATSELLSSDALDALRAIQVSNWENELCETALAEVFADVPFTSMGTGSLTYGELTPSSLRRIFALLEFHLCDRRGLNFVDLGSGFGRVLLGVACLDNGSPCFSEAQCRRRYSSCRGIEVVPHLHDAATRAHERLEAHPIGAALLGPGRVSFVCADALECAHKWLPYADVVYVCCTCFDDDLIKRISEALRLGLKEGALLVTVCKRLQLQASMELLETVDSDCSWGHAEIYIERRLFVYPGITNQG